MPRQAATKIYADFSGGFITEGNPLSYPENAAIDIDNLDIEENATVKRRLGVQYDASSTIDFPAGLGQLIDTATNTFKWESVNGNTNLNIAVVQVGDVLYFYYLTDSTVSSTTEAAAPITLQATDRPSDSTPGMRRSSDIQVAEGGGRLYVVGKYIDPFVLEFTEPLVAFETGTLTVNKIEVKIRDFKVFKEGEFIGSRSISGEQRQDYLSGAHMYNLANQGWPATGTDALSSGDTLITQAEATCSFASDPDDGIVTREAIDYTHEKTATSPDGSFFPTVFDPFNIYQAGGGNRVLEQKAYSPFLFFNDYTGNTPAPRGRLIKEAFYNRRYAQGDIKNPADSLKPDLVAAVNLDEIESSATRPETAAFYAGRVWYAGLSGQGYSSNIYFSQIILDDIKKAGKCYQEADPTAEEINELVATDGGVISLEDVGKIYRIRQVGPSLVVIASNGIWTISGDGEFSSFNPTAYSLRKITDNGAVNEKSVVFARDAIYYWGDTAIYRVALDQAGVLVSQDITASTIKSFYQALSITTKQNSFSVFDEGANKILWFYGDTDDTSFTSVVTKVYNKVLYYDVTLGVFGKYTIGISPNNLPVSAISVDALSIVSFVEEVTDLGEVVADLGEDVTDTVDVVLSDASSIKLMTIIGDALSGYQFRFSEFSGINFLDWENNFTSFMETGFDSAGDIISKAKKAPIVQVHLERTEDGYEANPEAPDEFIYTNPSGCLVSYKWDWGEVFTNQFQAYRLLKNYTPSGVGDTFDYDRSIVSSRNRLRGRGTSLGFRFESEQGKDMRLLGYALVISNRDRV